MAEVAALSVAGRRVRVAERELGVRLPVRVDPEGHGELGAEVGVLGHAAVPVEVEAERAVGRQELGRLGDEEVPSAVRVRAARVDEGPDLEAGAVREEGPVLVAVEEGVGRVAQDREAEEGDVGERDAGAVGLGREVG